MIFSFFKSTVVIILATALILFYNSNPLLSTDLQDSNNNASIMFTLLELETVEASEDDSFETSESEVSTDSIEEDKSIENTNPQENDAEGDFATNDLDDSSGPDESTLSNDNSDTNEDFSMFSKGMSETGANNGISEREKENIDEVITLSPANQIVLDENEGQIPVLHDIDVNTYSSKPVDIDLLSVQESLDDDDFEIMIKSNPSHGILDKIDHESGIVTYTPEVEYRGKDGFTYTVSNKNTEGNVAIVTININKVEGSQLAYNDINPIQGLELTNNDISDDKNGPPFPNTSDSSTDGTLLAGTRVGGTSTASTNPSHPTLTTSDSSTNQSSAPVTLVGTKETATKKDTSSSEPSLGMDSPSEESTTSSSADSDKKKLETNPVTDVLNHSSIPELDKDLSIVAASDFGCDDDAKKTIKNMEAISPDIVMALGDLSHDDFPTCWLELVEPLKDKIILVKGNYDAKTWDQYVAAIGKSGIMKPIDFSHLKSSLEKYYYSFTTQGVHFIILDSEASLDSDSDQYIFLKNDLQEASTKNDIHWIVVSFHRSPYYGISEFFKSKPPSDEYQKNFEKLITEVYHPLFNRYGVDIILAGHEHNYQRSFPLEIDTKTNAPIPLTIGEPNYLDPKGELYLTVGTGGDKLLGSNINDQVRLGSIPSYIANTNVKENKKGFLELKFTLDQITGVFRENDGGLLDQFSITKGSERIMVPY